MYTFERVVQREPYALEHVFDKYKSQEVFNRKERILDQYKTQEVCKKKFDAVKVVRGVSYWFAKLPC